MNMTEIYWKVAKDIAVACSSCREFSTNKIRNPFSLGGCWQSDFQLMLLFALLRSVIDLTNHDLVQSARFRAFSYICKPFSAKQPREMTKFRIFWRA